VYATLRGAGRRAVHPQDPVNSRGDAEP
jgi:hypothetical protein